MIAARRAISATLKGSNARFWAAALGGLCLFVLVVIIAGAFMRFKNPEVWKLGVAVLGPYVTAVGFLFALQQLKNTEIQVGIAAGSLQLAQEQNRNNQNWKKNEFLAARMREFLTDETTARALEMLDYSGAEIEVKLPGNEEPASVYVPHGGMDEPVQSATGKWLISLERCLAPHTERAPHQVTKPIREIFDKYLVGIEQFEIFIRNGLVTKEDVELYLPYHISLLNGLVHHSQGYHGVLYRYISMYNFRYAFEFLGRFKSSAEVRQAKTGVSWPAEPLEIAET